MAFIKKQRKSNDCGPTCFTNALNILGYEMDLPRADKLCRLKGGTTGGDLCRAFYKYGFYGIAKEFKNDRKAWKWLMKETSNAQPTILSVFEDTHWILVLMASEKEIQILDPSWGEIKKMKMDDFLVDWGFFDEGGNFYTFFGMSFKPFKKKSINAVNIRKKMLKTIPK